MLIKVNPEKKATLKSTWTSRFVHMLIRIFFFPVTIEGDKVCFRWLSCKTLIHITLGFGLFTLLVYFAWSSSNFLVTVKESFSQVWHTIQQKMDKPEAKSQLKVPKNYKYPKRTEGPLHLPQIFLQKLLKVWKKFSSSNNFRSSKTKMQK